MLGSVNRKDECTYLYIKLPYIHEEGLDSVVVLAFVQEDKFCVYYSC